MQQTGGITNSSGVAVVRYGLLPNGDYGYAVYDTSGNLRVQLGQLPTGDYGLTVTDPTGHANEVWPVSSVSYTGSALTTSSSSYVSLSGSPSLTVYLGASGDALVTVNCVISIAANGVGEVALLADGSLLPGENGWLVLQSSAAGQQNISQTCRLSSIGAALGVNEDHTFTLQYKANGTSSSFTNISIIVQPL